MADTPPSRTPPPAYLELPGGGSCAEPWMKRMNQRQVEETPPGTGDNTSQQALPQTDFIVCQTAFGDVRGNVRDCALCVSPFDPNNLLTIAEKIADRNTGSPVDAASARLQRQLGDPYLDALKSSPHESAMGTSSLSSGNHVTQHLCMPEMVDIPPRWVGHVPHSLLVLTS